MALRRFTMADLTRGVSFLEIEAEFAGEREACDRYAWEAGFRWKSVAGMLFGGYYVDQDGDCLMPT
jgi:hypothetical protein